MCSSNSAAIYSWNLSSRSCYSPGYHMLCATYQRLKMCSIVPSIAGFIWHGKRFFSFLFGSRTKCLRWSNTLLPARLWSGINASHCAQSTHRFGQASSPTATARPIVYTYCLLTLASCLFRAKKKIGSFVFWEILWSDNLLTVLSDL